MIQNCLTCPEKVSRKTCLFRDIKKLHDQFSALTLMLQIPPLASYNQGDLHARIAMHTLHLSKKRSEALLLVVKGTVRLDICQRQAIRQVQLLPCLSLSCPCSICKQKQGRFEIRMNRHVEAQICITLSVHYSFGLPE